jgi:hypothetical protein
MRLAILLLTLLPVAHVNAADLTREQVIADTMKTYAGPNEHGVNPTTMTGKVLCGYQGWFAAEGDGLGRGFYHWCDQRGFKPGACKIDLWPDVSELDPDERYKTAFTLPNGKPAEVFSAYNKKTVLRHFKWMRDYGIDGVFVQRFIVETLHPIGLKQWNTVLSHCREGANRNGRTYAVMYDLSGLGAHNIDSVIEDWKLLCENMEITDDAAYLHHHDKPVVAIWGFGFNDGRKYTLDEGIRLIKFFKDDPHYGNNTVMVGVPTYWREMKNDSVNDPKLHELIQLADIVSPWTVGRYNNPEQADKYARTTMAGDFEWCRAHGKEFLPVVFPGFSWHNMFPKNPINQIPRLGGKFLWRQYENAKQQGATMVYQAMFDEVDEGTAIFKCTNDPPVGESKFVTYDGLPSDHYLKLVGEATKMIRAGAKP